MAKAGTDFREEGNEEASRLPHPVHQTAPQVERDDAYLHFICKELHEDSAGTSGKEPTCKYRWM